MLSDGPVTHLRVDGTVSYTLGRLPWWRRLWRWIRRKPNRKVVVVSSAVDTPVGTFTLETLENAKGFEFSSQGQHVSLMFDRGVWRAVECTADVVVDEFEIDSEGNRVTA